MDFVFLIKDYSEKLISEPLYLVVLSAFVLIVAWCWPKKQRWRVKASYRALDKINAMSAPVKKYAYLRKVEPFVFEEMILSAFKSGGVKIKRNRRYTGDGGIDGKIVIDGRDILIQAKRYAKHINPKHVEAFSQLCQQQKTTGLFIHTGKTGAKSKMNAGGRVTIISGHQLLKLLEGNVSAISD